MVVPLKYIFIVAITIAGVYSRCSAQMYYMVKGRGASESYLIKAGHTKVHAGIMLADGSTFEIHDPIVLVDSNGVWFEQHGPVELRNIRSMSFRPYSKRTRIFNTIYYWAGANMVLISFYNLYSNPIREGDQLAAALPLLTFPIWGILIPGIINIGLYFANEDAMIRYVESITPSQPNER